MAHMLLPSGPTLTDVPQAQRGLEAWVVALLTTAYLNCRIQCGPLQRGVSEVKLFSQ